MRLVRLLIPEARLDEATRVLDEQDVDRVVTDTHDHEDDVLVEFPVPVQGVERVLDSLREVGVDDSRYTVLTSAESARTPRFADLEERYIEGAEDDSVSGAEIRSKARSLLPDRTTYYAMTALSALVATAGILLDSPAIVIGSMAIAPQVGAAITAAVGSVLGDRGMVLEGARSLVFGLLFAVVSATVVGWVLVQGGIFPPALDVATVEQVSSRTSPGYLSLVLGLCAGAAAGFGVATDLPLSLVGVAIAAAVVPAAAAVGIGIVWGLPIVAVGAGTLLVVNTASILLAAVAALWYLGYRPDGWEAGALGTNLGRHATLRLVAVLVVLAAAFVPMVSLMSGHVGLENTANGAIQETLEGEEYADLSLVSTRTEFRAFGVAEGPREVRFTVSRRADVDYPDLAETVADRVASRTGQEVAVTVEFVERRSHTSR